MVVSFKKEGEKMSRIAPQVSCTEEELKALNQLIAARKTEQQKVLRARIVLKCTEGLPNNKIAEEFGITVLTVQKWRTRFLKGRLDGLEDALRSGKPQTYTEEDRNKVLKLLEEAPPKGQSSWDGNSVAKRLGISHDYVWRVLRKEGIQLQRTRSWCVSTDPEFAAKAADVIGLYLNPPERALVLSVDEKPSIQALGRKRGYVATSSKKIVQGLQSTYKRNGTLNLFAALNVATGVVKTKTTATKKREDFQAFLEDVLQGVPSHQQVHVILDNYSTHKRNESWLKNYPNVHFHFTPTSASWLNQVEIWFGILTRKALINASFSSVQELAKAIQDFTDAYHQNARPFVWKKREVKGSQLRNTITNLCN
jgi:transposase